MNPKAAQLEGGTYEIIRNRLENQATELQKRLQKLNEARKEIFGATDTRLLTNNRISTENNCTPRDMVAIGDQFIFGYNVQIRLRTETHVADVFSVFRYQKSDHSFQESSLDLLKDERFESHFQEMYKYYKETVFLRFAQQGPNLYMIFQTGKKTTDIKAFKWIVQEDKLVYSDNRSEHEFSYPPQQEFEWKRPDRTSYREGMHPHVSIQDRVFVETVGGDLTVKVEDNTETGEGIYAEPVDREQNLNDAEFYYADLGNLIVLKIKPRQEDFRYLIFNEKLKQVTRVDEIEEACILLPDNQGLIFSNGYYLQSGERKQFDHLLENMIFEKRIQSPNGEDCLYVFHNKVAGIYILLSYNLITQSVETPIVCNGYSLFHEGELAYFKSESEASKNHLVQVWQTPYASPDFIPEVEDESFIFKVGNKDLVRGMADVNVVIQLLQKREVYATLYKELAQRTQAVLDAYYWLSHKETFQLDEPLKQIKDSAGAAIDEFEKVTRVKERTQEQISEVENAVGAITNQIKRASFDEITQFVKTLDELRGLRGRIISLRDLRYADAERIDGFEEEIAEQTERISEQTVRFLLQDEALNSYRDNIKATTEKLSESGKVAEIETCIEEIDQISKGLELLIDIVSNLKIEDATQTTKIIDNISALYASINQVKAEARTKRK
ncbi:MAG: DNA repair ATPase, partial [Bacteroidota bacterium]